MLRILHLEDCSKDAFLIEKMAGSEGVQAQFTVVRNRPEFITALEEGPYDLILADHGLQDFDGVTALKMAREKFPGIRFICVSGSANPDHIQASLDAGATEYVLKDDLSHLVAVLRREEEAHRKNN